MHSPIILATWSFGQRANRAAWPGLIDGGSALAAVEAAGRDAEDDLSNHTVGAGGWPDADGHVTLDASIMLSPARCGSVCAIRNYPNPISLARRVMERTPHILLAAEGAEKFAKAQGFATGVLLTEAARQRWLGWKESAGSTKPAKNIEEWGAEANHDTIGVLALDSGGTLAGACTTSGMAFKLPGRVGDSPIIGHALYVDPAVGAAVATGHGERVMGVCGSFLAVEQMRNGATPSDAARAVIQRIAESYSLTEQDQVGVIVLARDGRWSSAALQSGFRVAVRTREQDEMIEPEFILRRSIS